MHIFTDIYENTYATKIWELNNIIIIVIETAIKKIYRYLEKYFCRTFYTKTLDNIKV